MEKHILKAVSDVVATLVANDSYKAAKYLDPKTVVRVSRKLYKGRLATKRSNLELLLTIGRPNYAQRAFIKTCVQAGEPFPVKKVQLQFPPKRRK